MCVKVDVDCLLLHNTENETTTLLKLNIYHMKHKRHETTKKKWRKWTNKCWQNLLFYFIITASSCTIRTCTVVQKYMPVGRENTSMREKCFLVYKSKRENGKWVTSPYGSYTYSTDTSHDTTKKNYYRARYFTYLIRSIKAK